MKHVISAWLCLMLLALLPAVASLPLSAASGNGRKVQGIFEGELVRNMKLYRFSGRDYLSVKDIAGVYGARLVWHQVTGKVSLFMHNRQLDIYLKSTRVVLGDKKMRLSSPSRYLSNDLYIPVSFVLSKDFAGFSETSSIWNPETNILTVERKTNVAPPRFYSRAGSSRVIIEFFEDLPYDFSRQEAGKAVVAVQRGRLDEGKNELNDGILKEIETKNRHREGIITLTLADAASDVTHKLLDNPRRLVIDIAPSAAATAPAAAAGVALSSETATVSASTAAPSATAVPVIAAVEPAAAAGPAAVPIPAAPSPAKKMKLVVLDAGHGGEDPGAIGRNGTMEKDINLAIVLELKRLFENDEDGEYDVFLTRKDDTFIPLVERTSVANEKRADLFVSIHCNADFKKSASGFEIYFLNERASDEDAAATAMLENSVIQMEGKPTKKRARLQELLWSLVVNEFINDSSELCSFITGEVTRRIKTVNRGVKQAGFFVLRGAEMPAVLVECAFISHPGEEAKLRSRKHQAQIADAIYEGIKKYDFRKTMAKR